MRSVRVRLNELLRLQATDESFFMSFAREHPMMRVEFPSVDTPSTAPDDRVPPVISAARPGRFFPRAPQAVRDAGLAATDVEALILKAMLMAGAATGRSLCEQLRLPGPIVRMALDHLRAELLVVHRGTADLVDFVFQLTEVGTQRAKQYAEHNTYCGSAPVTLDDYVRSVTMQSLRSQPINVEQFRKALSGLYLETAAINNLAQAVNAGRGLFLFGKPGNGKTTIAERLAKCFSDYIWIPRAILAGGEIVRLYDSSVHHEVEPSRVGFQGDPDEIDRRWALIERPTIVVGGELLMEHLEIGRRTSTSVLEAPVQMKATGGVLLIDDFGRQRVSPTDILNRWIVPLDRARDYLSLPNGRQIVVPFDLVLALATNLQPHDLVDEAFLRRIPFKIELPNPTEQAFKEVFLHVAANLKLACDTTTVDRLLQRHYQPRQIEMRFCQPRDLLFHVANICSLYELPRRVTDELLDLAVNNYFFGMFTEPTAADPSSGLRA